MLVSLVATVVAGCDPGGGYVPIEGQSSIDEEIARPEGWTEETHGNKAEPNYEVVFPQDMVNQIKITISPENWKVMQSNMAELFGAPGTQQQGGQPGVGGARPEAGILPDRGGFIPGTGNVTQGRLPGFGGELPDGGVAPDVRPQGIPGLADMTPENPAWIPATIEFNGLTWTNVGVRYKGNSSLRSGWSSDTLKLPLKLDFDEFEDEYPEIDNQRFYGFKQLSMSNSFSDSTYMHDALAADILADAGLVAAETAWYEVIIDYGDGPVNLGLYIMIEAIDDTVIDRYFSDDSGNIYEADGSGVSLAQGTLTQIESSFQKENNEVEADWSDIEELYKILHSTSRTSDRVAWRENLESVFDVDFFLEWLSISAIIQHWDTYGSMSHNFYLYHDPATGLLTWISWDHNQVLAGGGMGARAGRVVAGIRAGSTLSLNRNEVTQQWPLVRFLLDDPVYYDLYIEYLEEMISGAFNPDILSGKCQEMEKLIAPYIAGSDQSAFESAVQELINRIHERYQTTADFLESER